MKYLVSFKFQIETKGSAPIVDVQSAIVDFPDIEIQTEEDVNQLNAILTEQVKTNIHGLLHQNPTNLILNPDVFVMVLSFCPLK